MPAVSIDLIRPEDLPVRFGDYELLQILGAGGMGRVFRADLRRGGRFRKPCALKVLFASVAARAAETGRGIEAEARLGALLRHPNIVETYDYGEVNRQPFIAMELVEGPTLDALLRERGAFPAEVVVEVALQACAGLQAAHELSEAGVAARLVHRDLKPANFMLSRAGQLKIADFGIAKASILDGDSTATGFTKGTPAYMSPEQARGEPVDCRSDLFALGVLLFELATGARFFDGDSLVEVISSVVRVDERLAEDGSLDAVSRAVPGLDDVVRWCLQGEADKRPTSAGVIAEKLRGLGLRRRDLAAWLVAGAGAVETAELGVEAARGATPGVEVPVPAPPPTTPTPPTPEDAPPPTVPTPTPSTPPTAVPPPPPRSEDDEPPPTWLVPPRQSRRVLWAGVAGAAALLLVGGWAWLGAKAPPEQAAAGLELAEDAAEEPAVEVVEEATEEIPDLFVVPRPTPEPTPVAVKKPAKPAWPKVSKVKNTTITRYEDGTREEESPGLVTHFDKHGEVTMREHVRKRSELYENPSQIGILALVDGGGSPGNAVAELLADIEAADKAPTPTPALASLADSSIAADPQTTGPVEPASVGKEESPRFSVTSPAPKLLSGDPGVDLAEGAMVRLGRYLKRYTGRFRTCAEWSDRKQRHGDEFTSVISYTLAQPDAEVVIGSLAVNTTPTVDGLDGCITREFGRIRFPADELKLKGTIQLSTSLHFKRATD